MDTPSAINTRMAAGAAWMLLFKLLDRAIGFVSIVVLARLLVPADFGLVTLAASTIAVLEVIGAFGLETALVQRAVAERAHFDAAWSFNVLFGLATALVTAALAAPAASFYGDPRLVEVMLILAVGRALHGFENVGIVAFRRELRFDYEFRFLIVKRIATALVTMVLAVLLQSYRALLIGTLAGTCIGIALSYALHPFRPRPSLRGLGELMHFSKWLFVANVVDVLHARVSDLIVGRVSGATSLGTLAVANDLARLPTRELAMPVNRAVFPGYVHLAANREALRRGYLKVASLLVLLVMPAAIGLALLAEPAVLVLLGARWEAAVPLVQVLAINGFVLVLLGTSHQVNLAVGTVRSLTIVLAADVAITLPLVLLLVPRLGALGAAWGTLIGSLLTAPLNAYLLARVIRFGRHEIGMLLARPARAAAAMFAVVLALRALWPLPPGTPGRILFMGALAAAGAAVYAAVVYALWARRADPEAPEASLLRGASGLARRARGWLRARPS
jgi:O-antigen/teichoic acid export membrane protein